MAKARHRPRDERLLVTVATVALPALLCVGVAGHLGPRALLVA